MTGLADTAAAVAALLPDEPAPMWDFYLPDDDRSTGWTNHGYVLQLVCSARGVTAEEAAAAAVAPDGFHLPESVVAIRRDALADATLPERTVNDTDQSYGAPDLERHLNGGR